MPESSCNHCQVMTDGTVCGLVGPWDLQHGIKATCDGDKFQKFGTKLVLRYKLYRITYASIISGYRNQLQYSGL